jgi:hypothetical protein
MSNAKIRKMVLTLTVLSPEVDDLSRASLEEVIAAMADGPAMGEVTGRTTAVVEGREAIAHECDRLGGDIAFFEGTMGEDD